MGRRPTGTKLRRAALACALAAACAGGPPADLEREVGAMLARSASDWNRGDLAGFMSDYAPDSLTSYVTAGHVQYGWQALYDTYQANYFAPGRTRDSLAFEEIAARPLGGRFAVATARFKLVRGDSTVASGPFTLVLEKRAGRWLILHDHTSPDERP